MNTHYGREILKAAATLCSFIEPTRSSTFEILEMVRDDIHTPTPTSTMLVNIVFQGKVHVHSELKGYEAIESMKYYRAVLSSVNGLCSPNRTRQNLAVHDDVLHLVILPHAKNAPLST